MKKVLLVAAIAATLCGPTFVASAPAFATQVVAQSAMQTDSGMKSAIDKLHDQMSTMTPSGDADKDYKSMMKMLGTAMKSLTEAEMKDGKDAKTKESAKSTYNMLFGGSQNPFFIGG